jgi:hypothetical protein
VQGDLGRRRGQVAQPAEDLPTDFEDRRVEHYQALRKPLDASAFIDELQAEMRAELDALHQALPACDWLEISDRVSGAIKLTPLDAASEPAPAQAGGAARWGTVPLIDMLKEAVLRTGCLSSVTSIAGRGSLPEHVLAERLLLAIYGYGTNTGIRAVSAGEHGHSEDEIRYARRRYLTAEAARQIAIEIANATVRTAIRVGTASTEAILRRFMKAHAAHPTYQAMIELGRAQKTIFVARYLRSRALQREIHEGLNVVESWNRANAVIFYGKGGDLASNRRDEQEMSVLCHGSCTPPSST